MAPESESTGRRAQTRNHAAFPKAGDWGSQLTVEPRRGAAGPGPGEPAYFGSVAEGGEPGAWLPPARGTIIKSHAVRPGGLTASLVHPTGPWAAAGGDSAGPCLVKLMRKGG